MVWIVTDDLCKSFSPRVSIWCQACAMTEGWVGYQHRAGHMWSDKNEFYLGGNRLGHGLLTGGGGG